MIDVTTYSDAHSLLTAINKIADEESFTVLDMEVAASVLKEVSTSLKPEQRSWMAVAIAACHRSTRTGHSHIDLTRPDPELARLLGSWPNIGFWQDVFSRLDSENEKLPIVWEQPGFLYLRRFWKYEALLTEKLSLRFSIRAAESEGAQAVAPALLDGCAPEQIQAIEATTRRSVVLLSGGPGTGKTFTVLRCIGALLMQNPEARISLLAPTGKAVARLTASITSGIDHLPVPESVRSRIPTSASTIHRFLNELENESFGTFVPVPTPAIDWIFVDEVSMVDLRLMKRLLETIPDTCRLFMLGDVHQLASVEPGSVFSDIYEAISGSDTASTSFETIELCKTFRFSRESPIFQLCEAVRTGDLEAAKSLLSSPSTDSSLHCHQPGGDDTNRIFDEWIEKHIVAPMLVEEPQQALTEFTRSLLLCATNRGPFGVETLNRRIHRRVEGECRKQGGSHYWSPILITQNDYRNDLFNGDIGLQRRSVNDADLSEQVIFIRNGELRIMSPSQLPAYSEAFALTIHKSQGSEAENVMVLLPEAESPVLTRELLYTAISRAKAQLHLIGSKEAVEQAIRHRTRRDSRLTAKLQARLIREG